MTYDSGKEDRDGCLSILIPSIICGILIFCTELWKDDQPPKQDPVQQVPEHEHQERRIMKIVKWLWEKD